jgi:hypothetical protein
LGELPAAPAAKLKVSASKSARRENCDHCIRWSQGKGDE